MVYPPPLFIPLSLVTFQFLSPRLELHFCYDGPITELPSLLCDAFTSPRSSYATLLLPSQERIEEVGESVHTRKDLGKENNNWDFFLGFL